MVDSFELEKNHKENQEIKEFIEFHGGEQVFNPLETIESSSSYMSVRLSNPYSYSILILLS